MSDVRLRPPAESPSPASRRLRWATIAVLTAIITVWAVPYIDRPFGLDHGQFGWAGNVIVDGGISYRDAWDVKGPVVHAAFAAIQAVLGAQTWGARVVDLLIIGFGVWLLWHFSGLVLGSRWAWSVAFVFLAWYMGLNYESTAQPDGWVGIALLAVVAGFGRHRHPATASTVLLGALIGVCALVKPTYALCGIVGLTFAAVARDQTPRAKVRTAGLIVAGSAIAVGLVLAWLAWRGALTSYLDIMEYAAVVYTRSAPFGDLLLRFVRELTGSPALGAAFLLSVIGVFGLIRTGPEVGWPLLAWLISTLVVLILGGWFYPYHWLPVYPPLSLLAVAGAQYLTHASGRLLPRLSPAIALGTPALVVLVLAGPSLGRATSEAAGWWRTRGSPSAREEFERDYFGEDGRHSTSLLAVAAYLRQQTEPDEPVGYFGTKAGIYYFADRPAVTRFGQTQPLLGGADNPFRRRYRTEFLAAFDRHPPRYLVARQKGPCDEARARPPFDCLDRFAEFAAVIESRYVVDTLIGKFAVHRLADPTDRSRPQ